MNCLEFRFRLSANPRDRGVELLAHREACPACAGFSVRAVAFEDHLTGAIRLPVPETLSARLVLNQAIHHTRRKRRLAVAASMLLLIGSATVWWEWQRPPLEHQVLAHVLEEREVLTTRGNVPATAVASVLHATGIVLRKEIGEVRYAGVCQIGRHAGGHLVLPGSRGPITVLLLPREPVDGRRTLAADGFSGVIVPVGTGSMAIVGEPGENLEPVEQRLQTAVLGI